METMPFGRFRGLPLSALPDGYLHWLVALPTLRPPLRGAILAEVVRRRVDSIPPPEGAGAGAPRHEVVNELVGTGLRSLARKHHPDVGGDTAKMQEINAAAEWLRRVAAGQR